MHLKISGMMRKMILFVALTSLAFVGCVSINLYEKQTPIPDQKWTYNFVPEFSFQIKDTVSRYNLSVVIRHTDMYAYNNIWIKLGTQTPGDTVHFQRINLVLVAPEGEGWLGSGMNDIYEVRKNISPGPISFKTPGIYNFSIAQVMRDNPLAHIMSIGMRLEKVSL